MHCPGHFKGRVITATGVTPDIVLANFFILCHKQFSRFELQTETFRNISIRGVKGRSLLPTPILYLFPPAALKEGAKYRVSKRGEALIYDAINTCALGKGSSKF